MVDENLRSMGRGEGGGGGGFYGSLPTPIPAQKGRVGRGALGTLIGRSKSTCEAIRPECKANIESITTFH